MASKLKNIQTIKNLLDGTSKFQTRKSIGFGNIDAVKERNRARTIGEIWAEVGATGEILCWWEQKDGYKVKYNMHPDISKKLQEVRDELNSFPNCPKETCTCVQPKPIDIKFRKKTGMCEDCTISTETQLKIQGKFREYAVEKMRNNATAFFKDADQEVEVLKQSLASISFVNSDGAAETWSMENLEKFQSQIDEQYKIFKTEILTAFGGEA